MSLEESQQGTKEFFKSSKRMLIVDDDETIRHILRRVFIGEGCEVLVAKDGLEAKEGLKAEKAAVVLTDIKMDSFRELI